MSKILVINDKPDHLGLMSKLLKGAGYSVLTADDGLEGFEVAKRESPNLIISDVATHHVDGIALS